MLKREPGNKSRFELPEEAKKAVRNHGLAQRSKPDGSCCAVRDAKHGDAAS